MSTTTLDSGPARTPLTGLVLSGACLLLLTPGAAFAGESVEAHDDHLVAIAGETLSFSQADLTANDVFDPGGDFAVIEPPQGGAFSQAGTQMHFTPDAFGHRQLTYRLSAGAESSTATLTVHVAPPYVPIAGRWSTEDCRPGACQPRATVGHGAEIGWFESRDGLFVLCDWLGDATLSACREIEISGQVAGWTPLVFDHDGDGFDEIALRDPTSGELRIYSSDVDSFADGDGRLPLATLMHGLPSTRPLVGDWTGAGDRLGLYTPSFDIFVLDSDTQTLFLQMPAPEQLWPLAGDWLNDGRDLVGLVDLESFTLSHTSPLRADLPDHFVPPGSHSPSRSVPFSGRYWSSDSRSFFGIFDQQTASFRLLGFWGEEDPLPLDMLVDPPSKTRFATFVQ